ncbi:hypothetical protein Kisp01_70020 [Kineosporia sp. NBRC 101677]|nr:hypothetical protein Kisp01_70020 [Kineosporia sp. NBRC 101677]
MTFLRLDGDVVRVLHEGMPVADVPGRDLTEHLTTSRWWLRTRRRRRWRDLQIDVTTTGRVVIRLGDAVGPNTLTPQELKGLRRLAWTPSSGPYTYVRVRRLP